VWISRGAFFKTSRQLPLPGFECELFGADAQEVGARSRVLDCRRGLRRSAFENALARGVAAGLPSPEAALWFICDGNGGGARRA